MTLRLLSVPRTRKKKTDNLHKVNIDANLVYVIQYIYMIRLHNTICDQIKLF